MKKYIPYILAALLITCAIFFATENAFSQTNQKENFNTNADSNVTTLQHATSPTVVGITAGRARSIAAAVMGLLSLVISWMARARIAHGINANRWRTWAIIAVVLGTVCIVLSAVQLGTARGAFGTGTGKAGAIVALVLGLIGTTLSGLALRTPKAD